MMDSTRGGELSRAVGRSASAVAALGAAIYIAGDLLDVVGAVPNLYVIDGDAARVEALESHTAGFVVEHALSAAGLVVAALGLWRLGLALRQGFEDGRVRAAGTVVAWAGLATGLWALDPALRIVAEPTAIVAAMADPPVTTIVAGAIYLVGIVATLVALGLSLLRLRHQRWLAWVLCLGAPAGGAAFVAGGASLTTAVVLVAGAALWISPPRTPGPTA